MLASGDGAVLGRDPSACAGGKPVAQLVPPRVFVVAMATLPDRVLLAALPLGGLAGEDA